MQPIKPTDFVLPFVKKEQRSKDAYMFYFDRVKRGFADFHFLPGQYIRMTLQIDHPDERGTGRFFSITSSPLDKQFLTITTRIIQSAFKKTLASLAPGQEIKFFGPLGRFTFDETDTRPHIFLAGGIGITPYRSMLTYIAEKHIQTPVTLFVSFSTVEELVFYDEFMKISADHPNIKVVYTITKSEESKVQWNGETGRIDADLIRKYCPSSVESLFYIAGPPAMVLAMEEIVKGMDVPQEQIKKEQFTGY